MQIPKTKKTIFILLFFIFSLSLFPGEVFADFDCECFADKEHPVKSDQVLKFPSPNSGNPTDEEKQQCNNQCIASGYQMGVLSVTMLAPLRDLNNSVQPSNVSKAAKGLFFDPLAEGLGLAFKGLIYVIFTVMVLFLEIAAMLFQWILDPRIFSKVVDSNAVQAMWITVRDFLNLGFIMILLFSAFSTIFQYDKFSLRKILLTLVIMALLVNFSFPIARFIIDVSNELMYFLINGLFPGKDGAQIFANFGSSANLGALIADEKNSIGATSPTFMIAATIFVFIFAITLLTIAVLMIVRMIALAILVIFSPIGFVAGILPSTSSYSSKWWDNLFQYSFFGPIMMFMLAIAANMMGQLKTDGLKGLIQQSSASGMGRYIGDAAYFTVPIVILWMGIIIAKKSGMEGASYVTGQATKFAKWGMNRPWAGVKFAGRKTGITGGVQQKWAQFKKSGVLGTDAEEMRAAQIAGSGPFKVKNAVEQVEMKRIKDAADKNNIKDIATSDVENLARTGGDRFVRAAAIAELSNRKAAKRENLEQLERDGFNSESKLFRQIQSKMKSYDPYAAFGADEEKVMQHIKSGDFNSKDVSADALKPDNGGDRLIAAMFAGGVLNQKGLDDLTKKGDDYKAAIKASLKALASTRTDMADKNNQKIQMANFIQNGDVSENLDDATKEEIVKYIAGDIDADFANKISKDFAEKYKDVMAGTIPSNKYSQLIQKMDKEVAPIINTYIQSLTDAEIAAKPKLRALHHMALSDPKLQWITNDPDAVQKFIDSMKSGGPAGAGSTGRKGRRR